MPESKGSCIIIFDASRHVVQGEEESSSEINNHGRATYYPIHSFIEQFLGAGSWDAIFF